MSGTPQVAQVVMPEKGQFLVRCMCPPPPPGTRVLVSLDYGQDIGVMTACDAFDPARHGARMPGFQLLRPADAADDAAVAENEAQARAMRTTFAKIAQTAVPDLRVPYARLSLRRTRLFVRFTSAAARPDLGPATAEMRRLYGVSVHAWQMGPRDEVSLLGGLGPCGRPCCCATWQRRYPSHLTADRFKGGNPAALNGTCGRFKCCLAFEGGCERCAENETCNQKG